MNITYLLTTKKIKLSLSTLILMILVIPKAYADCQFNGKTYPQGTNIGGLVCQPNGTWKRVR